MTSDTEDHSGNPKRFPSRAEAREFASFFRRWADRRGVQYVDPRVYWSAQANSRKAQQISRGINPEQLN